MEKSDTPRTDALARLSNGLVNHDRSRIWSLARNLERELAAATRERDEARAEGERLRSALQRLACLGNGDRPGNSEGNVIALEALAATEPKP